MFHILPTEIVNKKECIRAEIDKIEIENENILKDSNGKALGDIDVLAINIDKDYRVRSFLLTARTNYYGLIENEVEYITWAELVKKVEQNRL